MKKKILWTVGVVVWIYVTTSLCMHFYTKGYMDGEHMAVTIFNEVRR